MITSLAALSGAAALPMPAWSMGKMSGHGEGAVRKGINELSGAKVDLHIADGRFATGGRSGHAIAVNGTVPGPLIRLKEGEQTILSVHNMLDSGDFDLLVLGTHGRGGFIMATIGSRASEMMGWSPVDVLMVRKPV